VFAKVFVIIGQQGKPAEGETGDEHQKQRRENAADAASVEIKEGKTVFAHSVEQDAADEKPGDDKKDVDADKAAFDPGREEVVTDNCQYCERA
jgi:hypothetical protein